MKQTDPSGAHARRALRPRLVRMRRLAADVDAHFADLARDLADFEREQGADVFGYPSFRAFAYVELDLSREAQRRLLMIGQSDLSIDVVRRIGRARAYAIARLAKTRGVSAKSLLACEIDGVPILRASVRVLDASMKARPNRQARSQARRVRAWFAARSIDAKIEVSVGRDGHARMRFTLPIEVAELFR